MKGGELRTVPICLAMLLADMVWKDPMSGKKTILGTFDTICSSHFPCVYQTLAVYCLLTGGRGQLPLALRLVDASDPSEEPLFVATQEFEVHDPRGVFDAVFVIQNAVFPREGEYRFQLRCGGDVVMERRLVVHRPGNRPVP
jgi:hypothetical protein